MTTYRPPIQHSRATTRPTGRQHRVRSKAVSSARPALRVFSSSFEGEATQSRHAAAWVKRAMPPQPAELDAEVCIVTGANSGIGKVVTGELMARGHHVIMACRNLAACEDARQQLLGSYQQGSAECSRLDLQDFGSIKEFSQRTAAALQRRGRKLSVLVNNAGVMGVPSSASGEDMHLRINHLGPFLLTHLMVPAIKPGGRVVNVASRAHYAGGLEVAGGQIRGVPRHWMFQYARSKLCNVLHVAEMQRRLAPLHISATSVSPGFVGTSLFNSLPPPLPTLCRLLAPYIMRTPAKGAETVVYAAVAPELEGKPPVFLHDQKEMVPSAAARNPQLADALWRASCRLVGVEEDAYSPS